MRCQRKKIGRAMILLGVVVLAALILPKELWPFCIAVLLIGIGIILCRK